MYTTIARRDFQLYPALHGHERMARLTWNAILYNVILHKDKSTSRCQHRKENIKHIDLWKWFFNITYP